MKLMLVLFSIILLVSFIFDSGVLEIFSTPLNSNGIGDLRPADIWTGTYDEAGNPVYYTQVEECVEVKSVFIFNKGCTSWAPVDRDLGPGEVFELVGQGNVGIAKGAYDPIPGKGFWVGIANLIRGTAWSISVNTGIAFSFVLMGLIIIGGFIALVMVVKLAGHKSILPMTAFVGVLILGTMTVHKGGQILIALAMILGFPTFVVYTLGNMAHFMRKSHDGSIETAFYANLPKESGKSGLPKV